MCEQGLGTEKDYEQAAIWYRRNADEYESIAERDQMRETTKLLMIPESFFSLGCLYYFGRGMEQNYSTALYWFTKAAYYDHANAQYNIGCMYDYGEGVPQDERKAFQWFQRAANNGSMDAKYNLGVYYELGKGLDRPDVKKAIELYQEASSLGHQGAMQCLQRLGATAKTKKIISSPKGKDGVGIFSRVKSLFK